MNGDRMMRWLVRGIPVVMFLLTAVFLGVAGVILPIGSAANSGPGSGQIPPGHLAFGAALVLGGAALVWLAWGVWRARTWPTHLALVFSVAMIVYLAWVAPGAYTPFGSSLNPSTGRLEPNYDTGAQLIVLAIIPYAIVLACLVIAELRQRRLGLRQ